jgi:hypothetical protein
MFQCIRYVLYMSKKIYMYLFYISISMEREDNTELTN